MVISGFLTTEHPRNPCAFELYVEVLRSLSASSPWFMKEVGHHQRSTEETLQKINKMKSDVSDVGSHVVIYTDNIHNGPTRRTPVTTAYRFAEEAPWTRTVLILSRGSSGLGKEQIQHIILSSLLFNKI